MSFKAMAWAADQKPPTATAKLALLMMASMADRDTNRCWPSYQRLADDCMCSRRTIARTVATLQEHGYITVENRFNQSGQTSNVYTINLDRMEPLGTLRNEVSANMTPGVVSAKNDTVSATMAHPPSDTVAHETVTSFKQSEIQSERGVKQASIDIPAFIDGDLWKEFVQHRKEIRKKLTPTSSRQLITSLAKEHNKGRDVNEAIRRSIQNGWQGIFFDKQSRQSFEDKISNVMDGWYES